METELSPYFPRVLFAFSFLLLISKGMGREDPWTLGNMKAILSTPLYGQSSQDV